VILQKLKFRGLIHPPSFLVDNCHYLTIMGSVAYACNADDSDWDVYGFCIPPKNNVFSHLNGEIQGFGRQTKHFEQWQQHHIKDEESKKEYDFQVYSIVKFFQLLMDNNVNVIDTIFVPQECVIHQTKIGQLVRENRHMFLHRGFYQRAKGYSYSQLNKMKNPNKSNPRRKESIEKWGFDTKHASHVVRLLDEAEQVLSIGDLNVRRCKEQMKAIRRGEVSMKRIEEIFADKERQLEELYNKSSLPYGPDETKIKALLMDCLEEHYGSLSGAFDIAMVRADKAAIVLDEIKAVMERHGIV